MREVIYKAIIPLEPRSKKNNLVIKFRKVVGKNAFYKRTSQGFILAGIPFVSQSDLYKEYENDAGYFLRRPKGGTITDKVNIRYLFYRSNERRIDLSNCVEACDDILVKYHIISDDNFKIVKGHDGTRLFIDKSHPRTEIYIERWEE